MRIGGLASGMDIDSIVADLMKAQRMPLDKLKQKKQTLEWQRDDYRSMNTLLLDFRSELTQMKLSSNYRARTTTSTNETKISATATSAATQSSYNISSVDQLASAATKVNAGSLSTGSTKIDATKGIYAQTSNFANTGSFTWNQGVVESKTVTVDPSSSLVSLGSAIKDLSAVKVSVNGTSYKAVTGKAQVDLADNEVLVNASGDLTFKTALAKGAVVKADFVVNNKTEEKILSGATTEWQLARGSLNSFFLNIDDGNAIQTYDIGNATGEANVYELKNTADSTQVIGKINKETGKITFEPELTAGVLSATYDQNYASFSVGAHTSKGIKEETFLVQGNDSLNSVINKVNSSNVGVSMFYDSFSDQVTLTRAETGNFNGLDSSDTGYSQTVDNEINTNGSFLNDLLRFGSGSESGGENAIFSVNGLSTERNSNTFEMNGVTFTLKQTFANENIGISVNNDSTKVFENIKSFVEKYNELIDKIGNKLSEESYRSYKPLTDDQREQLSDKQQEQWEEKAKSGLLKRDPILSGALSQMRNDFYARVSNSDVLPLFNQLASIGISTSPNYREGGKLIINEAKLKKAIETDPNSVENLFKGTGSTYEEKGIIQRLYDSANSTMEKLKSKAGNSFSTNQQFSLGRELTNVDSNIDRFENRLKQVEDRYWRQFTAMEKAVQRSNQQSMYLMQQFGGGM